MITKNDIILNCENAAARMRINTLRLAFLAGQKGAHLGGCLSVIEILASVYGIMKFKPGDPGWQDRDRFILSKGHASLSHYTALEASGIISEEKLFTFEQNGGDLPCASSFIPDLGIEFPNGSLGFGLTYAVGLALASSKGLKRCHVYVLLGDGECNEGLVWEAAMSAAHFKLSNLTAIIDLNSLQSDGKTCDVMNVQLENMWTGFGWEVFMVDDGNDVAQLVDAFTRPCIERRPRVIIARTIKGKGVSYMENNSEWHHKFLSRELFDSAMTEIARKTWNDTN